MSTHQWTKKLKENLDQNYGMELTDQEAYDCGARLIGFVSLLLSIHKRNEERSKHEQDSRGCHQAN